MTANKVATCIRFNVTRILVTFNMVSIMAHHTIHPLDAISITNNTCLFKHQLCLQDVSQELKAYVRRRRRHIT